MLRTRVLALACLAVLLSALLPGAALAEEDPFPYGRYEGSAVGDKADSKPIAIKVWLRDGKDGTVLISVSTPAVPFAFDTNPAVPVAVPGGFDLPISLNVGSGENAISGSGTVRIRKRGGAWEMWGSGSGSAMGNSGGGRGSAARTKADAGIVDAFVGPLADTFGSFTSSEEPEIKTPEVYPEAEFADAPTPDVPAAQSAATGNWFTDLIPEGTPPNEAGELLALTLIVLLAMLLGIFLL